MARPAVFDERTARIVLQEVRQLRRQVSRTSRSSRRAGHPTFRSSGAFVCTVRQTGGSAGNATTQCSFTYEVKDLNGTVIGTGKTPKRPRPTVGKMDKPPDNNPGIAYYDGSNVLQLWDAGEVMDTSACS